MEEIIENLYADGILPRPEPIVNEHTQPLIDSFRERDDVCEWLKESHYDEYLLRWIIARDNDLDAAAEMFVESMKWREENNVDTIIEWYPLTENYEKVMGYWPSSRARGQMTVEGWPLYYERVGVVDSKDLLSRVSNTDLEQFHIYEQECREELRRELYEEHGFSVGTVFVQDLGGLGMKILYRPGLQLTSKLSDIDKKNYPEVVRKMFMINAPSIFPIVWKVGKGLFDKKLITKFSILSNNGLDIFTRMIPEGEIPTFAGGTREDAAPGGKGYNWNKTETMTIPKSQSVVFDIEIEEKNSVISWFFLVDSHDIKFSITLKGKTLFETDKVKNHEDEFVAAKRGVYQLVFDNTYSWTKSKTIHYKYNIAN